uniref:Protein quiver n=1 Tax=Syphacia muris TaxID=451379 RepID=A0A0N5AKR1_9BILA
MFLLIFIVITVHSVAATISCFSCVSELPETTPKDAQTALKSVLSASYNLPLVDKYCSDPNDVFFRGVSRSTCPSDDQCVKISATNGGKHIICNTRLSKIGVPTKRDTEQRSLQQYFKSINMRMFREFMQLIVHLLDIQ